MTDLEYVVDVFTERTFAGNPLAVVLGAESRTVRCRRRVAVRSRRCARISMQFTTVPS